MYWSILSFRAYITVVSQPILYIYYVFRALRSNLQVQYYWGGAPILRVESHTQIKHQALKFSRPCGIGYVLVLDERHSQAARHSTEFQYWSSTNKVQVQVVEVVIALLPGTTHHPPCNNL